MEHLDTERILAYLAENCSEEELFQIDGHLADCPRCAQQVRQHFVIRENFDAIWDSWTARRHAQVLVQERVQKALDQAAGNTALEGRLRDWLRHLAARTAVALEVTLDAARHTAHVVQDTVRDFCREGILPLTPVPLPERALGMAPPEGRQPAAIRLQTTGPPKLEVSVEPEEKKVTVRLQHLQPPWPLAALIPKAEGPAQVAQFRHPHGQDYLLAEFEDLPDGDYFIFLEVAVGHG